jgi:hypothetical protein
MARIQYQTPAGLTGEIELNAESMSVGRADDNAIVISDESVSSHHGEFTFDGAEWFFTDTGSTNGTKVNGERVEQFQLSAAPAFTLGSVECVFIGDQTAEDTAAAYSAGLGASMTSDGYGALPYDKSMRTGFGPKTKPKSTGGALYVLLGLVGLAACGAAVFMFQSMAG